MTDQQFCLRWNNHQSTLISVFDTLLENGTLVDCTLAAEGQYLKAHKVVLSACSPYLETLLSQHYEKHPIVILKDVKFTELKSMMDYMYRGEVNISQDQLGTFLKAAESLQIKGLSENGEGDARDVGSTQGAKPQAARKTPANAATQQQRPEAAESPANRDGSISPTSRKRRRIRRSSDDDNHLDANSCDLPSQAQSTPIVPNIPASITSTPIKPPIVKPEVNDRIMDHNSLPPESGLLKEKIEPAEPLLEPKTEYLEDLNNDDSVEDLTLDDDDEMDMSQMSNMSNISRPGPSHGADLSNQGFAPWQLGNQSGTDEVFMAAQEAVNAQRDSQGDEQSRSSLDEHHGQDDFTLEEDFFESSVPEEKFSCQFYSELEDPAPEDVSPKVKYCLGKECDIPDHISISKFLRPNLITGCSNQINLFGNDNVPSGRVESVTSEMWELPSDCIVNVTSFASDGKVTTDNFIDIFPTKANQISPFDTPTTQTKVSESVPSQSKKRRPNRPKGSENKKHNLNLKRHRKLVMEEFLVQNPQVTKSRPGRSKQSGTTKRHPTLKRVCKLDKHKETSVQKNTSPTLAKEKDVSNFNEDCAENNVIGSQTAKKQLLRKDLFVERDRNHKSCQFYSEILDRNTMTMNKTVLQMKRKTNPRKYKQSNSRCKQKRDETKVDNLLNSTDKDESNTGQVNVKALRSRGSFKPSTLNQVRSNVVGIKINQASGSDAFSTVTSNPIKQEEACFTPVFLPSQIKVEKNDTDFQTEEKPSTSTQSGYKSSQCWSDESEVFVKVEPDVDTMMKPKRQRRPRIKRDFWDCETCGKKYRYNRGLRQHQRLECNKEPQFPCPYCPTKFRYPQAIRDHIKQAHSQAFAKWYATFYCNMLVGQPWAF